MKKNISLLMLVAALTVSSKSVMSATATITSGYAHGDMPSLVNKTSGFNVKYRYEKSDDPIGVISSFTYTEKNHFENGIYKKGQYYGVSVGPAYRLNEKTSIYGMIGAGYGRFQKKEISLATNHVTSNSDYDFTYGVGLQINPTKSVALDFSYEQSRIRNVDVSTWIAGVGYHF